MSEITLCQSQPAVALLVIEDQHVALRCTCGPLRRPHGPGLIPPPTSFQHQEPTPPTLVRAAEGLARCATSQLTHPHWATGLACGSCPLLPKAEGQRWPRNELSNLKDPPPSDNVDCGVDYKVGTPPYRHPVVWCGHEREQGFSHPKGGLSQVSLPSTFHPAHLHLICMFGSRRPSLRLATRGHEVVFLVLRD